MAKVQKVQKIKGVALSADVLHFANDLPNFNGATNWLLRRLKNDTEMQKELELATGIKVCHLKPDSSEPPRVVGHQANAATVNDWEIDA